MRNPAYRGTCWENFDFDAAEARVRAVAKELAAQPRSVRPPPSTEHARDYAAQGVGFNPQGWGR